MRMRIPESEPEAPPLLTLARRALRRWDLTLECSGTHSWIQTTSARKKVWLILEHEGQTTFEPLD